MNKTETARHLLSKSAFIYMNVNAIIGYCLKNQKLEMIHTQVQHFIA
jgi:hypothetical protein